MSAKRAQTPRIRRPLSDEHRQRLSEAQKRYVENDPRWAEHRQRLAEAQRKPEQRSKLSAAQKAYMDHDPRWPDHRERMMKAAIEVTRMTLFPEEVETIVALRRKGRTFEYLAEELCVGEGVIRRGLQELGIPTCRPPCRPRAKRGKGFWRSFD